MFTGRHASITAYTSITVSSTTIGDCTDLSSFSRLPQIVYIAVEMPLLGRRNRSRYKSPRYPYTTNHLRQTKVPDFRELPYIYQF